MSVVSSPLSSDMANGRTGGKMEIGETPEEAAIADLIDTFSSGSYTITSRGKDVLKEFGEDMTLDDLRNLPEFIATQINATNDDFVYVKPHIRSGKKISAYIAHKSNFNSKNPNVEIEFSESYREKLKSERKS